MRVKNAVFEMSRVRASSPLSITPLNFLSRSLFISPSDETCTTYSFHYILHFHAHSVSSSFPERPALISPLLHSLHPPLSLCSLFALLPFSLVFFFMYVVSLGLLLCTALSKSINMSGYCGSHSECLVRPCGRRAGLQIYQHTHPHRHALPQLLHVTGSTVFQTLFLVGSVSHFSSPRTWKNYCCGLEILCSW